jgi:hypothetical protein
MGDVLGLAVEARDCLRLADVETHSDIRTFLMGMAAGWLMFAQQLESTAASQGERPVQLAES